MYLTMKNDILKIFERKEPLEKTENRFERALKRSKSRISDKQREIQELDKRLSELLKEVEVMEEAIEDKLEELLELQKEEIESSLKLDFFKELKSVFEEKFSE